MLIEALIGLPAAAGLAAWRIPWNGPRRALLVLTAAAHAGLTAWVWTLRPDPGRYLGLDSAGLLILSVTSILFLAASVYAIGYLAREGGGSRADLEEGFLFSNAPEAVFSAALLFFLSAMTAVAASRHLLLLWGALEATTLASAPLVLFHRHHRSLEAAWKYLLIGSVGIALALLGNFLLAASAAAHGESTLHLDELLAKGKNLDPAWAQAAFLFLVVGYGTKMGLVPLHTWLPDAHGESPSVVSALLSGALLNNAMLAILRGQQVLAAAGQASFGQDVLVGFGLVSMLFAAALLAAPTDYKRMLAYSSVEHMGLLALGLGLGAAGAAGSMLHAVNHSLAKGMLFLVSGNLLFAFRTKSTLIRGVLRRLPGSGFLWLAGLFALSGAPPFGTFISELAVLRAAVDRGRYWAAAAALAALSVAFVGMSAVFFRMARSDGARDGAPGPERETAWSLAPPLLLGAAVLVLGVYVPPFLQKAVHDAGALVAPP